MINVETFAALRNYAKGKIDAHQLMDADKLFDSIKEHYRNPAESIIRIDFRNKEDLLKTLGLADDDIYFYFDVTSPYNSYEFIDHYSAIEEFSDGYGFYNYLDEENMITLSQIARAILPKKIDFEDAESLRELSAVLLQNFKRETEDIIDDYAAEKNYQMNREAYKVVEKELIQVNDTYSTFKCKINGIAKIIENIKKDHRSIHKRIKIEPVNQTIPNVEIKIWLRALRITSEEYHWINYFSYHMFLAKLLVRHCERCMPLPFQQYYGKLYIVSTEPPKKWKIMETADLQNILENVSISVHEYFETNIEPLLQDE
jgi:hypothetical protein